MTGLALAAARARRTSLRRRRRLSSFASCARALLALQADLERALARRRGLFDITADAQPSR